MTVPPAPRSERSPSAEPGARLPGLLPTLFATEQVRYLLVAGVTSTLYVGWVALGLWAGLHYMLAIGLAQVVTIAGAFPAYRRLVFRSRGPWPGDLARFLSVWSSGMVAGFVATPLLVELVGLHPLVAQVIAIVVVAVGSYLGHRYITFRHRGEERNSS